MQNPYFLHRVLADNIPKRDVEILPEHILGLNDTASLLDASQHIDEYEALEQTAICHLLMSAFERIFQVCSEQNKNTWENIEWRITEDKQVLEATSSDNDYYIYFQFFKREDAQWLRVHYEGPIELDIISSSHPM